jgi:hypothetical protein
MIYVLVSTTRVNRAADTLPIILTFDVYGGGRELGGVRLFEEQRAHYHMCANKEMPTAPTSMPAGCLSNVYSITIQHKQAICKRKHATHGERRAAGDCLR